MNNQKDQIIFVKSCLTGTNKSGGTRIQMYFKPDQVATLIEELGKGLDNPRGIKIDLNSKTVNGQHGTFPSYFCFVKGVQERPEQGQSGYAEHRQPMPGQAAPPANPMTSNTDMQAKIARLKQEAANAKTSR